MPTEKPETAAEAFIRVSRMQYARMWPSNLHLFADMLSSTCYVWENGLIKITYADPSQSMALTEHGWEHAKNTSHMPTSWSAPSSNCFMKHIPDDADPSWLHEIDMFCYHLERVSDEMMLAYLTAHYAVNSTMAPQFVKAEIDRNMAGYRAVKAILPQARERTRYIQNQRYLALRGPIPATVEKDAVVRYKFGVKEATVLQIVKVPNDNGNCASIAILDRELDGSAHHFVHMLVAISSPSQNQPSS